MIQGVLALAGGFLVGTIPVGYWLGKWTGVKTRRSHGYNVGFGASIKEVGVLRTILFLAVDFLKGAFIPVVVGLFWPEAAVFGVMGVVAGHLYSPFLRWLSPEKEPSRGRGVTVLFGAVFGLGLGGGSFIPVVAGMLTWAIVVSLPRLWSDQWGYPSLANVTGALVVPVVYVFLGKYDVALVLGLVFLLILWRHKENLGRVLDGIEVRLGQERPLPSGEGEIACAFLVHPMTVDDFWQPPRFGWLESMYRAGLLNERMVRYLGRFMRPMKLDEYVGIESKDGKRLRVYILGAPLFAEQIVSEPDLALKRAKQAARLARDLGARDIGLGAFWSVVGNKGMDVQEGIDIPVTNGGGYTAGTVKIGIERALAALEGKDKSEITAAIVGANGVVGLGIARSIGDRVGKLIMIGRNAERLERSRKVVAKRFSDTEVVADTKYDLLPEADIIFTATSSPEAVIFPEHVKPGAIVFDIGRPPDVSPEVADVPDVKVIPGGVVRPPGGFKGNLDVHFGENQVPACLAETMVLALTGAYEHKSLGDRTRTESINFLVSEAEKLGFEVVDGTEL